MSSPVMVDSFNTNIYKTGIHIQACTSAVHMQLQKEHRIRQHILHIFIKHSMQNNST